MECNVYRIGAVVNYSGINLLVLGYDFIEKGEHISLAYKVVPYPQGYTGEIKLLTIDKAELVQEGYATEVSDGIYGFFKRCAEVSDKMTAKEMKPYLKILYNGTGEVK